MYLCSNCRERLSDLEPDASTPFPAWTVAAGTLASVAAAATGALLLIPAALVAGALKDTHRRRCEICETEVDETDDGYRVMSERKDHRGRSVYRPIRRLKRELRQLPKRGVRRVHEFVIDRRPPEDRPLDSSEQPGETEELEEESDYVFDESQGVFVSHIPDTEDSALELDFPGGFEGEASLESFMPEFPEPDGFDAGSVMDAGRSVLERITGFVEKLMPEDPSS